MKPCVFAATTLNFILTLATLLPLEVDDLPSIDTTTVESPVADYASVRHYLSSSAVVPPIHYSIITPPIYPSRAVCSSVRSSSRPSTASPATSSTFGSRTSPILKNPDLTTIYITASSRITIESYTTAFSQCPAFKSTAYVTTSTYTYTTICPITDIPKVRFSSLMSLPSPSLPPPRKISKPANSTMVKLSSSSFKSPIPTPTPPRSNPATTTRAQSTKSCQGTSISSQLGSSLVTTHAIPTVVPARSQLSVPLTAPSAVTPANLSEAPPSIPLTVTTVFQPSVLPESPRLSNSRTLPSAQMPVPSGATSVLSLGGSNVSSTPHSTQPSAPAATSTAGRPTETPGVTPSTPAPFHGAAKKASAGGSIGVLAVMAFFAF